MVVNAVYLALLFGNLLLIVGSLKVDYPFGRKEVMCHRENTF